MSAIYHINKKPNKDKLGNLVKPATSRDYKIAIRQLRHILSKENDKKLKQERLQFEKKLTELKKVQLGKMKRDREKYQREINLVKKEFKEQIRKNRNTFYRELEYSRQQPESAKNNYASNNSYDESIGPANTEIPHENPSINRWEQLPLKAKYTDQSPKQISTTQIEEYLDRLKREIFDELNKRDLGRDVNSSSPSNIHLNYPSRLAELEKELRNKNAEIEQLNLNNRKLKGLQSMHSEDKIVKEMGNSIPMEDIQDVNHNNVQEEVFDMIKEIAQEKIDQERKTHPTTEDAKQFSLGSKVSRKLGIANSFF